VEASNAEALQVKCTFKASPEVLCCMAIMSEVEDNVKLRSAFNDLESAVFL